MAQTWAKSESAALAAFDTAVGDQRRRGKDRLSARLELEPDARADVLLFAGLLPRMRVEGCPIRICTTSAERMRRSARDLKADLTGVLICGWEQYVQPPEKFIGRPDVLWQVADWEWGSGGAHFPPQLQRFAAMALYDVHGGFYHVLDLRRPGAPMIEPQQCDFRIFQQPWRPWPRKTRPY